MLGGLLPESAREGYARFERFGPLILLGIILGDYLLGWGILWTIMGPIIGALISLATGY